MTYQRRWLWLILGFGLVGCGPIGCWAGGELRGDVHQGTVPEWDRVAVGDAWAQLETNPADPYSIHIWATAHDGKLFVPTSLILGPDVPTDRRWVRHVLADPRVRLKLGDTIYPLVAERVTDEPLVTAVKQALMTQYGDDSAPDAHYHAAWVFELRPR